MRTLFFGSHNSHPSHPISALTVSSPHSILVPLAMQRPRHFSSLPTRALDLQVDVAAAPESDGSLAVETPSRTAREGHPGGLGRRQVHDVSTDVRATL